MSCYNYQLEDEDIKCCANCEEYFFESELNEYELCPDCEQELQDEKQSILDTQQSLNKQF